MDVLDSLRPDSILGDSDQLSTETPRQDPQRLCTRNSPCHQRGCMICITPINHVRNLDMALNGSNASPITHTRNLDVALNSRNASPITHIRNLDVALNSSNGTPTSLTTTDRPQPPINHPILLLTATFQKAIQENAIDELTCFNHLYALTMHSTPDFWLYDSSNLCAIHKIAMQILPSAATPCRASSRLAQSSTYWKFLLYQDGYPRK